MMPGVVGGSPAGVAERRGPHFGGGQVFRDAGGAETLAPTAAHQQGRHRGPRDAVFRHRLGEGPDLLVASGDIEIQAAEQGPGVGLAEHRQGKLGEHGLRFLAAGDRGRGRHGNQGGGEVDRGAVHLIAAGGAAKGHLRRATQDLNEVAVGREIHPRLFPHRHEGRIEGEGLQQGRLRGGTGSGVVDEGIEAERRIRGGQHVGEGRGVEIAAGLADFLFLPGAAQFPFPGPAELAAQAARGRVVEGAHALRLRTPFRQKHGDGDILVEGIEGRREQHRRAEAAGDRVGAELGVGVALGVAGAEAREGIQAVGELVVEIAAHAHPLGLRDQIKRVGGVQAPLAGGIDDATEGAGGGRRHRDELRQRRRGGRARRHQHDPHAGDRVKVAGHRPARGLDDGGVAIVQPVITAEDGLAGRDQGARPRWRCGPGSWKKPGRRPRDSAGRNIRAPPSRSTCRGKSR
jgi:hypothetical protein